MRIEEQPYDDRHGPRREGGPMDRNATIKPADAWGKPLTDGYGTVSPGVVQKEFEIVLSQGELLNEVLHGLFIKAEQIPSALPLFWRETGPINGRPRVLVQGHSHRVARFEELLNEKQRPLRNGWILWRDAEGDVSEVQRVLWLLWDGDRSKLRTSVGERVRCYRAGCETQDSPRWAVAFRVAEFGALVPLREFATEMLCQGCAAPNCDTAEFVEENE
jgi:hypothetical protein